MDISDFILLTHAFRFAARNLSAVIKMDDWKDAIAKSPRLVNRVFEEAALLIDERCAQN